MDSLGHVKPSMLSRTLPLTAVFVDDLRQCLRHWAFISWAVLATALTVLWFVGAGGRVGGDGVSSVIDKAMDPRHTVENGDAVSAYDRNSGEYRNNYQPQSESQNNNGYTQNPQYNGNQPVWQQPQVNQLPDANGNYARPTQTANRNPQNWQSYKVNLRALTAAEFGGWIIRWNLLAFATFAIALGATAISSEQELLADAILCRGVARWQYFVGKCASRSMMAALLFILLATPTLGLACLRMHNDLSWKGSVEAVVAVAGVFAAITALSVAGGAWFKHAIVAVAVMWMSVYGTGILIAILDIGDLSPFSFCDRCTYLLRGYIENLPPHKLPNWTTIAACGMGCLSFGFFNFRDI